MANRTLGIATQSRLDQFRAMEKETTDPFAARLVHEIIAELEARLGESRLPNDNFKGAGRKSGGS